MLFLRSFWDAAASCGWSCCVRLGLDWLSAAGLAEPAAIFEAAAAWRASCGPAVAASASAEAEPLSLAGPGCTAARFLSTTVAVGG